MRKENLRSLILTPERSWELVAFYFEVNCMCVYRVMYSQTLDLYTLKQVNKIISFPCNK